MRIVNVRIKYGGQVMAYECGDHSPGLGDWVVVKCDDLIYLGQVVTAAVVYEGVWFFEPCQITTTDNFPRNGKGRGKGSTTVGRCLLRVATEVDLACQAENELREREALAYCQDRVTTQNLDMKLVAVEMTFDSSKTIFYYTAEDRVDFRLLVKELVSRFRTRIEMRQIGVRHEARMVGGMGCCGRQCCCSGFLANFAPVSVKMAKEHNLSLNPAKISGVCGRLMCCLAFEHQGGYDYNRGGRRKAEPPEDETPKHTATSPDPQT